MRHHPAYRPGLIHEHRDQVEPPGHGKRWRVAARGAVQPCGPNHAGVGRMGHARRRADLCLPMHAIDPLAAMSGQADGEMVCMRGVFILRANGRIVPSRMPGVECSTCMRP
jgi:hypothetical protein